MRPLGQVHRRGRGDVRYQRVCGSTTAVSRKDHLAGRCKSVSASTPGRLHAMQAEPIAGCGWKWLYQQLQSLHVARHDPMSPPACSPSCSPTATYDHLANPSEHGPSQAAHLVPVHCRPAATPTDPMPPPSPPYPAPAGCIDSDKWPGRCDAHAITVDLVRCR